MLSRAETPKLCVQCCRRRWLQSWQKPLVCYWIQTLSIAAFRKPVTSCSTHAHPILYTHTHTHLHPISQSNWTGHIWHRNCLPKHVIEGKKWRKDEEGNASSYWVTLWTREDTGIWRQSTRSHSMENWLWKRLWTCCMTGKRMNEWMNEWASIKLHSAVLKQLILMWAQNCSTTAITTTYLTSKKEWTNSPYTHIFCII